MVGGCHLRLRLSGVASRLPLDGAQLSALASFDLGDLQAFILQRIGRWGTEFGDAAFSEEEV